MSQKVMINFQDTIEAKQEIENAAKNLGMSVSALLRTAVDRYIDTEIKTAQSALLSRAKPYFTHGNPERAIVEIKALLDGMNMAGMRTWGNPEVTPEDTFKMFFELKMKAA